MKKRAWGLWFTGLGVVSLGLSQMADTPWVGVLAFGGGLVLSALIIWLGESSP